MIYFIQKGSSNFKKCKSVAKYTGMLQEARDTQITT